MTQHVRRGVWRPTAICFCGRAIRWVTSTGRLPTSSTNLVTLDRLQPESFLDDRSPSNGLVNLGVNLRGMVQSDARLFHAEMQDTLTRKMPVCIQVSNITEVSGPTQWKPGQSGNLNGRPVGTRQAFSAGFYRDLAEVFAKHGRAAMEKTAIDQPRLLPAETRLTIEAGLPGGLDPGDWALLEAVRAGIPDAAHTRPGEVFERVLSALRQADAKLLDSPEKTEKRTVPFAPAKFVNDTKGRFYN